MDTQCLLGVSYYAIILPLYVDLGRDFQSSIVCWRAWVLWGRGWKVLVFPAISITAGVSKFLAFCPHPLADDLEVSSIGLTIAFSIEPSGEEIFSARIFDWIMPFFSFTFVTNLYAVGVISVKTWYAKRNYVMALPS